MFVIGFCFVGVIGGESSESITSGESDEDAGDGFLTRLVKALFPPLDPLPEDLKRLASQKPAKPYGYYGMPPYGRYDPIKSEAASLLGLLGSVVDSNVGKHKTGTQRPTSVRVAVTVPPAHEFFKPKHDSTRKRSVRQSGQFVRNPKASPRPTLPLYVPDYAQYNQTTPAYGNYNQQISPTYNQYNQQPAYNQTYNQNYDYSTTQRPYYYYPTTTLKPRPAPPVKINVTLPTTTTTTTTTYKPYTVKYGYGYGGYRPSYKPYYKPGYYKPMYKPYGMK